ncbi:hypothetical protein SUGI_0955530 [Cryptomeria japonica]|nr:hypothetical protein SUGI_0955530 [Cryptomeria japonica]
MDHRKQKTEYPSTGQTTMTVELLSLCDGKEGIAKATRYIWHLLPGQGGISGEQPEVHRDQDNGIVNNKTFKEVVLGASRMGSRFSQV